jgi:hypothetical protein
VAAYRVVACNCPADEKATHCHLPHTIIDETALKFKGMELELRAGPYFMGGLQGLVTYP